MPNKDSLKVMDRLKKTGKTDDLHSIVLKHVVDRLEMSERKMSTFYARWQSNEKRIQAYIDLPKYEKILKEMSNQGLPPVITQLTIPYAYSTICTIATYLTHTFTGRKPMFVVGANNALAAQNAPNMETLMQYQADARFMIKRFMQFFKDGETYGIGAMRCLWEVEKRKRTVRGNTTIGEPKAARQLMTTYEGNDIENIDPYMFFPDPRVPMNDVAQRGEFVFWRDYCGRHEIRQGVSDYGYKHVDDLGQLPASLTSHGVSARAILTGGDPHPGGKMDTPYANDLQFVQRDEGTCWIVPSKLRDAKGNALSDSNDMELWIFTIANKHQIIRAEPFEYDHGMHPVVTIEPHTVGYGFGQLGTADYLAPLQDAASWFLNSHIQNVRSVMNNMLVVNPAMIEMKDLASPKPGKIIRMKKSAMMADPRMAVHQLQVVDITRTHITDLESIMRMGDMLSSVNDNLRGIQDAGSRKTATEVRTSSEAGASRLAAQARLYSAQAYSPLEMQMCLNDQQFLTREMEMRILGQDKTIQIGPAQIVGDYYFPIHDGTLPLDKVALLDTWKEILIGCARDPLLRTQFNIGRIFEWTAELGGARNIQGFRNTPEEAQQAIMINQAAPGEDGEAAIQAGNAIPIPAV